ncbi:hypothetical protein [Novosphingobium sp. Leaf2]|uniref:hypothetical protein n=1 Tax=Novosphingobium sp. Leaf2 TaxID=1735670 RepID=UPI0006FDA12E|nr:hypothetical protein [Novosphingobium sp. Leaf2]
MTAPQPAENRSKKKETAQRAGAAAFGNPINIGAADSAAAAQGQTSRGWARFMSDATIKVIIVKSAL